MNHIHVCWFVYSRPNWLTIDPLVPFNLKEWRREQRRIEHRQKGEEGEERREERKGKTGRGTHMRWEYAHTILNKGRQTQITSTLYLHMMSPYHIEEWKDGSWGGHTQP